MTATLAVLYLAVGLTAFRVSCTLGFGPSRASTCTELEWFVFAVLHLALWPLVLSAYLAGVAGRTARWLAERIEEEEWR